jgi:hypothetical protein
MKKKTTTTKTPLIKATCKERARRVLISRGKKGILRRHLDDAIYVQNSPEIVSLLRDEGMIIDMIKVLKPGGGWEGLYKYITPKKVSKIESGQYRSF